jgi:iron complex transport system substrate-binding protein
MVNRRLVLLWLVLLPVVWVSGARGDVRVHDDANHVIALAQPAKRVISLAPHTTEMLYAIGAGKQVVAVSHYSNWPPAARALPRVSGAGGVDFEKLLGLHPDLVLAWGSGLSVSARQRLHELGVPVFISEPNHLDDIPSTMRRIGLLTGHERQAGIAAKRIRSSFARLRARYRGKPAVRVFYEIWPHPLMTIGGHHFINDVLRLCGGDNVFGRRAALNFSVGIEAVLAARPQVILGGSTRSNDWLRYWRQWPHLPAVAHGQIYAIPANLIHRPGPRLVQGAARVCADIDRARRAERR